MGVSLTDGEAWFITPENTFPLLQSPMAASFTPLQPTLGIAHGVVNLVCGWLAMETHSMKLPTNSYCADIASRGSLELVMSVATRWVLRTTRFSTRWSRFVNLCGLPLLVLKALTVYQGSSSRAGIWWTDLLERWHPITVPHWKSLSSSVRPFYSQCLSNQIKSNVIGHIHLVSRCYCECREMLVLLVPTVQQYLTVNI